MMTILFFLLVWHALADFPLQGDYLAKMKNRHIDHAGHSPWWWHMSMHALIHAGGVVFITGQFGLGIIEFTMHFVIDYLKIDNRISAFTDQALHVVCKMAYLWILTLL